ncbi:basic proline-rich protein-like [Panicum virgatum]|uniref:basic proline-rich protein-like n=1 Tax=Panicum virgatum TaxID=38727 RepID=UPI0019D5C308|nr:basic proline-rich protein-like [Panicum virgatum]
MARRRRTPPPALLPDAGAPIPGMRATAACKSRRPPPSPPRHLCRPSASSPSSSPVPGMPAPRSLRAGRGSLRSRAPPAGPRAPRLAAGAKAVSSLGGWVAEVAEELSRQPEARAAPATAQAWAASPPRPRARARPSPVRTTASWRIRAASPASSPPSLWPPPHPSFRSGPASRGSARGPGSLRSRRLQWRATAAAAAAPSARAGSGQEDIG